MGHPSCVSTILNAKKIDIKHYLADKTPVLKLQDHKIPIFNIGYVGLYNINNVLRKASFTLRYITLK